MGCVIAVLKNSAASKHWLSQPLAHDCGFYEYDMTPGPNMRNRAIYPPAERYGSGLRRCLRQHAVTFRGPQDAVAGSETTGLVVGNGVS